MHRNALRRTFDLALHTLGALALAAALAACGDRPDPIPTNRSWIELDPATVTFEIGFDTADPEGVTVDVTNGGDVPLAVPTATARYVGVDNWLSLGVFAAPSGYQVRVQPVGVSRFQPGTYAATISLDAPGAANTPATIAVRLVVDWPPVGWRAGAMPPEPLVNHSAIKLYPSGSVLVVGGVSEPSRICRLDPWNDTWTVVGDLLQTPRREATLTRTFGPDDEVLISGGVTETPLPGGGTSFATPSDTWELFDPATNTITARGTMRAARAGHSVVNLGSYRLLLVGGGQSGERQTAEILDTQTLTSVDAHMPDVFGDSPVVAVDIEGGALVVGAGKCLVFDRIDGTWAETAPTLSPRWDPALVLLPDGNVLAAGGYGDGGFLASSEIYSPSLGTWRAVGDLHEPQAWPVWAGAKPFVFGDGNSGAKVFAAGGVTDVGGALAPIPLTQVFDVATGTWSLAGSLATGRMGHTLTVLSFDEVVVIGGQDANSQISLRTEYYKLR